MPDSANDMPQMPPAADRSVEHLCAGLTGLRHDRSLRIFDEVRHVPFPVSVEAVRLVAARDGTLIARLRGRPGAQSLTAMDVAFAVSTSPRIRYRRWTRTTSRPTPDGTLELVIHSEWRFRGWLRR